MTAIHICYFLASEINSFKNVRKYICTLHLNNLFNHFGCNPTTFFFFDGIQQSQSTHSINSHFLPPAPSPPDLVRPLFITSSNHCGTNSGNLLLCTSSCFYKTKSLLHHFSFFLLVVTSCIHRNSFIHLYIHCSVCLFNKFLFFGSKF